MRGYRMKVGILLHRAILQIVLPYHSKLTDLIVLHEHVKHLHAGADATLAAVRQLYWPLKARGAVSKITRKCIKCFRSRPK